jgi:hypothetical protein
MTARFSVKNSHIEDDLILVLRKQTPTVKVITVRLKVGTKGRDKGWRRREGRMIKVPLKFGEGTYRTVYAFEDR